MDVTAALEFSVSVDGTSTGGALTGSGSDLELRVAGPALLGRGGRTQAREAALWLAEHGLRVTVATDRRAVTLGEQRVPRWQRILTGSPHIGVHSVAAAWRLTRGRGPGIVPPPTPRPLAPTFLRRLRTPTTTHDRDRGGYPRLVLAPAGPRPGDPRREVHRLRDVTTIGSDEGCDIRLAGLEPQHAVVRHDDHDEFVLSAASGHAGTRVNGAPVQEAVLRTGSRIELGGWTLLYAREEYADHGRPFAGRVGGELGRQRPQPPRGASA